VTPAAVAQITPPLTSPSASPSPSPSATASVETTTTTVSATTTVSTATTTPSSSSSSRSSSSASSASGGAGAVPWILLGVAVGAVLLAVLFGAVARRRQVAHARARALQQAIVAGHELADAAVRIPTGHEPAAVTLWWRLVESHQASLTAALSLLAQLPPDERLTPALAEVGRAHDALRAAIATDRNLRIGPPPPTDEQLAYSAAAVRERADALRVSADALETLILPRAVR
jgi:hypothetical protein